MYTNADKVMVIYGRMSTRHYWDLYEVHHTEYATQALDKIAGEYSKFDKWGRGEFALVEYTPDEHGYIPDRSKDLPGTEIKRVKLDAQP